jgi:hypothetical protein
MSTKQELWDRFTEDFVNVLCAYKKSISKSDMKFMLELFIAERLTEDAPVNSEGE